MTLRTRFAGTVQLPDAEAVAWQDWSAFYEVVLRWTRGGGR
jgi:hypothetical protein